MAIRYYFDLYPRTNPSGARLVRFTNLQAAEFRGEANGSGAGRFSIRATDSEAAFIDPDGLQYVRVVRDNGTTELVVGGFFLESGEYAALTETSTKLLSYGGAGTLSYLGRAVMDADSWINDPFIGTDPQPDGTWPLHLAGTGNELGAILWRVLHELEEPGRHQDPVPLMTLGFTHLVDSNAAAWVRETGDFVAQVTDGILSIIRRLMQLGLYVEIDPDTFEVNAYEPETHRRDRTGVAWGAAVVRFQSPTDGTIATGNIKSDAKRALEAKVRRNALLVGSNDTWAWVNDAGVTVPWEGGYILDDEDGLSLADAGAAQLAARSDAGDVLRLRMKLGESPTTGEYLPFEHVRLDDLVTVHTGTGQWDYNEAEFPVAALTVALRPGGDWDAWADLGSTYLSLAERAFNAQPVGAHTHPPNPRLCQPATGTPPLLVGSFVGGSGGAALTVPSGLSDTALVIVVGNIAVGSFPPTVTWGGDNATLIDTDGIARAALYYLANPAVAVGSVTAGGLWVGGWLLEGASQTALASYTFATATGTTSAVNGSLPAGSLALDAVVINTADFADDPLGPGSFTITATGGQISDTTLVDELGSPGYVDAYMAFGHGSAAPVWTFDASHAYTALSIAAAGSVTAAGDGHAALIGTSVRAKRCDDTEHYHTTGDPTVNDDTTSGFRNNTLWINESTGAMFLLLDNAAGAADWLQVGGVGADLSGINFLVGTASGDLSAEIVVGATPGGELGNTWASPTVDTTHSGSSHTGTQSAAEATAAAALATHALISHGGGEILIADTPAGSPLIFADLLQNEDGTDLLYSD